MQRTRAHDRIVRAIVKPLRSLVAITLIACNGGDDGLLDPGQSESRRAWRMGFSAIPPRANEADLLAALAMWIPRSDAAILHISPPWAALLSGTSAAAAVEANELPLVRHYRVTRNLQIVIMVDATDGLNRSAEAPELVQLGRSIGEPAVQQVYRQFLIALATIL